MALPLVKTSDRRALVHVDDPEVSAPSGSEDWIARSEAHGVTDGATVVTIRPLDQLEQVRLAPPLAEGAEDGTGFRALEATQEICRTAVCEVSGEDPEEFITCLGPNYVFPLATRILEESSPPEGPTTARGSDSSRGETGSRAPEPPRA